MNKEIILSQLTNMHMAEMFGSGIGAQATVIPEPLKTTEDGEKAKEIGKWPISRTMSKVICGLYLTSVLLMSSCSGSGKKGDGKSVELQNSEQVSESADKHKEAVKARDDISNHALDLAKQLEQARIDSTNAEAAVIAAKKSLDSVYSMTKKEPAKPVKKVQNKGKKTGKSSKK